MRLIRQSRYHPKASHVPVDEPRWWYEAPDAAISRTLRPVGSMTAWIAARRWHMSAHYQSILPVICIGNFTAGGTGKTPLALEVARLLREAGAAPVFLSRGYGGRLKGPHRVAKAADRAADVGDEVLLLAQSGETFVARDRAAGARAIEVAVASGVCAGTVIVMDDGLQNPSLAKDLTIAVVDGGRGFGNDLVMPAGPLRAALEFQMPLADAIVVNQPPGVSRPGSVLPKLKQTFPGPVLEATPVPAGETEWLRSRPVVAFAGIGNPARFFDLLRSLGANVVETIVFADHHPMSEADATRVLARADFHDAAIVTTEKDMARLQASIGALSDLRYMARSLPIRLAWSEGDEERLASLLAAALKRQR
jgi:tetraacyldisaccharide 4'-kinase